MADTQWQARAACRGVGPELFFPEPSDGPLVRQQVEAAKAVCRPCPVREQCLDEALERLPHGVAGGMTEHERRRARAQRVRLSERSGPRKPQWQTLLEAGCTQPEIAAEYGVSARTVARWAARLPTELAEPSTDPPTTAQGVGSR